MIPHEALDFGRVLRDGVIRQRLDKNSTILHALNPVIENGENAAIRLGADQAAEALLEREDGFGDLVFGEGVAAIVLEGADARGDDRIAGNGERQFINDDAGKLRAGNVHALPETGGGEEDGVGGGLEAFEENGAGRSALQERGKSDAASDALVDIFHLRVAGEEAKGAAFGDLEKADDFVGGASGKILVAHVGHGRGDIEERLLAEIEFGREDVFVRRLNAEALLEVIEASADGKSGGSQGDGVELAEEFFAQDFADVNGSGGENDAAAAALVPIDV